MAALFVGRKQLLQRRARAVQCSAQLRRAEVLDVLVRIVEHGVEMAAQVRQPVVDRPDGALERPAELPGGVRGGVGRLGVDEVDDGLGLRQVELAVQEGPAREFAGSRLPRPGGQQRLQPGGQHGGRAVALQLNGLLAGVAVRRAAHDTEALVNDAPLPVVQQAEDETAVRRVRKRLLRGENAACQRGAAGPGQAENADGAGRAPRRNGSNDVRHDVILSVSAGKGG